LNRSIRAWGANLLLVAASVLVTLGSLEIALRLFLPQKLYRYPQGLFREDPDLVFTLTPGYHARFRNPEYTTDIRINSLGLRGTEVGVKDPGTLRILGLGDSFTSALNVQEEQTFLAASEAYMQKALDGRRIEVINAGIPNQGTWHELRMLRRLLPGLQPDAIVLSVYLGNDLFDNLHPLDTVVRNGFLEYRTHRRSVLPYQVRTWLQRYSMSYVFLWNTMDRMKHLLELGGSDPLDPFRSIVSLQPNPSVEEGYRVSHELLRQIRDCSAGAGKPLLVVLIPAEMQTQPSRFIALARAEGLDPSAYDLTLPSRRWTEMAVELGLPVLDLMPVFRAHASGPSLWMSLDGHLTPLGNRLTGEAIGSALLPLLEKRAEVRP